MEKNICTQEPKELVTQRYREFLTVLERGVSKLPGAVNGNIPNTLKHNFGDGLYIRQITMPAGLILTTRIHKERHPYFILKGKCTVVTEDGCVEIVAPYFGMTEAGTKRGIYVQEETVWITVHATESTDTDQIEKDITFDTFEEMDDIKKREG